MRQLALLLVPLHLCCEAKAQGIINGGFEDYNRQTGFLPGWHIWVETKKDFGATENGVAGSRVPLDRATAEVDSVTLLSSRYGITGLPLGDYYLFASSFGESREIMIEQTVFVPPEARSLQFRTLNGWPITMKVALGESSYQQHLHEIILPGGFYGKVGDWRIDVTSLAGQSVKLKFTTDIPTLGLDDIHFSTEPVPEPGVGILGALGVCGLVLFRRKQRTRAVS